MDRCSLPPGYHAGVCQKVSVSQLKTGTAVVGWQSRFCAMVNQPCLRYFPESPLSQEVSANTTLEKPLQGSIFQGNLCKLTYHQAAQFTKWYAVLLYCIFLTSYYVHTARIDFAQHNTKERNLYWPVHTLHNGILRYWKKQSQSSWKTETPLSRSCWPASVPAICTSSTASQWAMRWWISWNRPGRLSPQCNPEIGLLSMWRPSADRAFLSTWLGQQLHCPQRRLGAGLSH